VLFTLGITYRAARQTKSASDFYAAGGGITAGQNGLAIAGDYMCGFRRCRPGIPNVFRAPF